MEPIKFDKKRINQLAEYFSQNLLTHPLFMYYCPDKDKRQSFIKEYFAYYIGMWNNKNAVIISESSQTMAVVLSPKEYEKKLSGIKSMKLKSVCDKEKLFMHMDVVDGIVDVLIPEDMDRKVLTLFGNIDENPREVLMTVKKAMDKAKEENFVLVYETFSKKLITPMEMLGFEIGYQRQFLNTQFLQTLMTYNF